MQAPSNLFQKLPSLHKSLHKTEPTPPNEPNLKSLSGTSTHALKPSRGGTPVGWRWAGRPARWVRYLAMGPKCFAVAGLESYLEADGTALSSPSDSKSERQNIRRHFVVTGVVVPDLTVNLRVTLA